MEIKNKITLVLVFILFFGFLLRLWGIGFGLPYLSHPDETRVILDTLSMGHRFSLIPQRPDYSLLYRYLLLGLYGCYFVVGKLLGIFRDLNDFAFKFMVNPTAIYIISRMVSVIFGTLTGLFSYLLAKRFFDKTTAFVTMLFVLFEFQLLQHSQWAIYPAVFSFTTLLAIYSMFRVIKEPSLKNFILMGVFNGISISTQNHGIFLLPPLAITVLFHFFDNKNILDRKVFFKNYSALILSLVIFSLLGNFYWFFIFKKTFLKYSELIGVTKVGFASKPPYANNIFSLVFWFVSELIRQDGILGIFLVLGLIYSIIKHTKFDIVFLAYVVTNLFIFSGWGFRLLHDMLGVMPIICVFGARALVDLLKKIRFKEASIGMVACLISLPLICDSVIVDIKKNNLDTRQLTKDWIEQNIPSTQKIAIDWYVFSVALNSDIPLYFRNPVARKYYEENIPDKIKELYVDYLKNKPVYDIIEIMESSDKPHWPSDMPLEAVKEANRHAFYRDIYSKFNFRSLEYLKKENVKYIIISSYLYGFFLLDSDYNKRDLFNPFIKDRPWINFSQSNYYIDDKRYGLLYFISRDARNFYLPLLKNELKGVVLIKEFKPDNWHLGPIIKIYKVTR
ncbi:MAG: glycosyltransferase family 39 protein [Candidatus Omnitrophota bacterium]|nr:glycosyltransferase family 39 protein [Candidatus Omnitrophota bacterium]